MSTCNLPASIPPSSRLLRTADVSLLAFSRLILKKKTRSKAGQMMPVFGLVNPTTGAVSIQEGQDQRVAWHTFQAQEQGRHNQSLFLGEGVVLNRH